MAGRTRDNVSENPSERSVRLCSVGQLPGEWSEALSLVLTCPQHWRRPGDLRPPRSQPSKSASSEIAETFSESAPPMTLFCRGDLQPGSAAPGTMAARRERCHQKRAARN